MVCLPLDRINFWLATIHPDRIRDPAARERVILYQRECADVLYRYFHRGEAAARHAPHRDTDLRDRSIAGNTACRMLGEVRRCMGARAAMQAMPKIFAYLGLSEMPDGAPDQPELDLTPVRTAEQMN
jgi:hypothetical protein